MCATVWRHLVKATVVTAETWQKVMAAYCRADGLKVTCGLTASTPELAPEPMLDNEYGRTLPCFYSN